MTTQDDEFDKWWNNNAHPYRCNPKEAFRAGRLAQMEKDAEKRSRIERLRGALKTCSGRFLDYDDIEYSNLCLEWAGDMEP